MEITTRMEFDAGHRIPGHKNTCKNLHGHRYALEVTIKGEVVEQEHVSEFGMVMDFSDLKVIVNETIVNPFDHATVLNINSPHKELADSMESQGHKIMRVSYQPTSEMMVLDFVIKIQNQLPKHLSLHHLLLRETDTSYAEWHASDQLV